MKLNVVGDPEQALINKNELDEKAMGGTELMKYALHDKLPAKLLKQFNIIPSRVRELAQDKENLLWLHDLPQDPESQHLKDGGWKKFKKLVYVSHWQKQQYEIQLSVLTSYIIQRLIEA